MCHVCKSLQIHVFTERHIPRMNLECFISSRLVWNSDLDFAIESPGSTQCWVDCVRPVGCTDYYYVAARSHSIHQRQELCDDSTFYFTRYFFTFWCDRVHFVTEDYARRCLLCFLAYLP